MAHKISITTPDGVAHVNAVLVLNKLSVENGGNLVQRLDSASGITKSYRRLTAATRYQVFNSQAEAQSGAMPLSNADVSASVSDLAFLQLAANTFGGAGAVPVGDPLYDVVISRVFELIAWAVLKSQNAALQAATDVTLTAGPFVDSTAALAAVDTSVKVGS